MKMNALNLRLILSAPCAAVTLCGAPQTSMAVTQANDAESIGLEEVVVTAQRVESTVQKTPIAVSAFDQNDIANKQIVNVLSIIKNVPNFAGANNVTLPTAVSLFIRGVGSTDSSISADPPVGLYIDDVVVARQQLNNAGIFDVQRVEVLRGPQGTLYGRNTAAGAIKMISNPPIDGYEAWLEGGLGNYGSVIARGVANAPLVDGKLFARANFSYNDRDGFTQNLTTGRKVNDLNSWSVRGALRYEASDALEFNLKADSSRVFSHGTEGIDIAGTYVPVTGDLFKSHSGNYPRNLGETSGVNGYIDWKLSDTLLLKSITGYRYTLQDYVVDFTDQPIPADINASIARSTQYSEELQLSGELGSRTTFVAGFYAMREKGRQLFGPQTFRNYSRVGGVFPPPGTTNAAQDPPLEYTEDYRLNTTSYALYAQGSYSFTDKLKGEVGLRYTRDDKDFSVYAVQGAPGATAFLFDTASVIAATGSPSSKTFSETTPHLGLNYQFTPDVMGYASYTKGFQAGGWFGRVRAPAGLVLYDATTVTAYELGMKNTLWGGRARLNVSAFMNKERDLPSSYASLTRPGTFAVASLNPDIWGVELESAVRVTSSLKLNVSAGWIDYKYQNFASLPAEVKPNIGPDLRYTPHFSGTFGLEYLAHVSDNWDARFSNNYNYTGEQFSNPGNTPAGRQPARTLVDAAVAFETQAGKYVVTLSCANCTDKEYFSNIIDFGGVRGGALPTSVVYAGDPRTYQATLKVKFY